MEELTGLVFDIEEFAVFDGPGIRTAVFLKGCPLRCNWCHNPEGLQPYPQRVVSELCRRCGKCREVCPSPQKCSGCGACIAICPESCIRIAGQYWTAPDLARKLSANRELLKANGGGITFSGGECAMQIPFVLAVRERIKDLHCAIETSGYTEPSAFKRLVSAMDLVIFDIKHTDPDLHKRYVGADNRLIRENLEQLKKSNVPFIVRVPLIPLVNDTKENLTETARWIVGAERLLRVELLPYHRAAGAKYKSLGMSFRPDFDESVEPKALSECFTELGIPVKVM